jgi:hypothetical protein
MAPFVDLINFAPLIATFTGLLAGVITTVYSIILIFRKIDQLRQEREEKEKKHIKIGVTVDGKSVEREANSLEAINYQEIKNLVENLSRSAITTDDSSQPATLRNDFGPSFTKDVVIGDIGGRDIHQKDVSNTKQENGQMPLSKDNSSDSKNNTEDQ